MVADADQDIKVRKGRSVIGVSREMEGVKGTSGGAAGGVVGASSEWLGWGWVWSLIGWNGRTL